MTYDMLSRRALAGTAVVALLVASGCSGDSSSGPSPAPGDPATSASATPATSPSADGSASPSVATLPAAQCLTGRYALVRFVALGGSDTYGTGQGGDIVVSFTGRDYTLSGAGREPVIVTLAGQNAELTVDGTARGTYAVDGSSASSASTGKATFTTSGADGTATLEAGGQKRTLEMSQIASVVGLDGPADVACTEQAMTLTLKTVRLELGRA